MALAESTESSHDASHDHHDHGEFIAHHFDSAEQQFDSGKLGIWIFLVTEVLFFSGLFVAYTLYRYHHPEIFAYSHQFLDKTLGAVNTIVLLFSSLTMAWAVRCSQLEQHRGTVINILITMVCAAVFLGVKAVEYTHKWDIGIYPAGSFTFSGHMHHHEGIHISQSLINLSIPPAAITAVFLLLSVFFLATKAPLAGRFFAYLTIMMLGYFLGVGGGLIYPTVKEAFVGKAEHHDSHHEKHGGASHAPDDKKHHESGDNKKDNSDPAAKSDAADKTSDTAKKSGEGSTTDAAASHAGGGNAPPRDVGIFFSIYYFMTGLHATHIVAGMIALSWLLLRAMKRHFRSDYFGPVDYVGLYWHLVDLIWIYLFPLLYLIG